MQSDTITDAEEKMFAARLLFDFLDLENSIRCIDAGALSIGGDKDLWIEFVESGCTEVIGFEPIAEECERLNASVQSSGSIRYLPYAIGDGKEHTLNITNVPMTSSLYKPAAKTVDIFQQLGELMQVVKEEATSTKRLDDIKELGCIDFIKMDIQGAELMALENAIETLKHTSVIQCEVEFVELYKGQPLFADVDTFLRSQGFCFLKFTYTMGRPLKPLAMNGNPNQAICQTLWGDAVYVKDFRLRHLLDERVLKSAAFILHEFYQGYDLANLFLAELDRRHNTTRSRDYLSMFLGVDSD
ncbi:FkbM family methyltransferase [Leptolyngbya sp. GB1-A1]|uniref:FkbM family methyltransferase n=1 Tax=Leptolyngbya sp. GB1-A1 TaxID=2933908 RepID=UPI00329A0559